MTFLVLGWLAVTNAICSLEFTASDGTYYDLRPLQAQDPLEYYWATDSTFMYYLNFCKPLVTGDGCTDDAGVICAYDDDSGQYVDAISRAIAPDSTWSEIAFGGEKHGISLTSKNGYFREPGRIATTRIDILCDAALNYTSRLMSMHPDYTEQVFTFGVASPLACASSKTAPGRISGGSIFVIILLTGLILYVLGGVFYNCVVNGKQGTDSLPHKAFWLSFFGLAADGWRYTSSKTQACFRCQFRGQPEYAEVSEASSGSAAI